MQVAWQPGKSCISSPGWTKLPARNWYCTSGEFEPGTGAHEEADRRGPDHQRAAPRQRIFEPGAGLAQPAVRNFVQGVGVAHPIDDAGVDVVLQILADPRQIVDDRDTVRAQQFARPDPGELQQLRRVDRAAGQHDLAAGEDAAHYSVLRKFETDRATALEQYPLRQRTDHDPQIGPLLRRTQIGDRCAAAAHVAHGYLQRSDPVLLGAVEIGVALVACLLGRGDEGVVQFVPRAQIGDVERAAGAVMRVGAALLVFGAAEIGQHVVIRPAGIAELAPQIEILLLPADVDQPVDRAGAAQHLAARPDDAPAAEFGCGSVSNCQVIFGW